MANKAPNPNQKIYVKDLHLYKQPNKQGYEKFSFYFCFWQDNKCYFPGTNKTFSQKNVEKNMTVGDEFFCEFDEKLLNPGTDFENQEVWIYQGNLLPMLLQAERITGNLPMCALTYLRQNLTERTYTLKALKEIENEFVFRQVALLKKQQKDFEKTFDRT